MKNTIHFEQVETPEIIKRKFPKRFPERIISEKEINLLSQLPEDIGNALFKEFQQSSEKIAVVDYFRKSSFISKVLIKDPGTFKMLEVMYTGEMIQGVIDEYVFKSLNGQALRNRLSSVITEVGKIVQTRINRKTGMKILNMGSGPARDTIEILVRNPHFTDFVSVDCADVDSEALQKGKELIQEKGFSKNFNFLEKNLMELSYRNEIDMGLLIGILCGLENRACVAVLKRIKRYFKKGGILVASNILETMLEQDPFVAWLIDNVIGWKLVYKTTEELQQIFEKAGYKWKGVFYDEPTRFHAMGIGMVPFT